VMIKNIIGHAKMLRFEDHSSNILTLIKEDLLSLTDIDTPDIIIICKDDEIVQTQKNLLCMFSPTLRNMLGSVMNMETFMIFMPDFKKATVQTVIRLLRFEWNEEESWDCEVVQLLQGLNMSVGNFQIKSKCENRSEVSKPHYPSSESSMDDSSDHQELEECEEKTNIVDHKTFPNDVSVNYEISNNSNFKNRDRWDVKCPNCPRVFTGTSARLKDKLKCHLGLKHFEKEIAVEVKNYFGSDVKCFECSRIFRSGTTKKKHLIFNHTKLVEKIMLLVVNAVNGNQQTAAKPETITSSTLTRAVMDVKELNDLNSEKAEEKGPEFVNNLVGVVVNENMDDASIEQDSKSGNHPDSFDDVDALLESDDEKETDQIQKLLLAEVSDDDESDDEDSRPQESVRKDIARYGQVNHKDVPLEKEKSEMDIQNQLLLDQDFSDSDDDQKDDFEDEEVDNVSYEDSGRDEDGDENQDDADLIQRNLLQDQDISDDDEDDD